MEIKTFSLGSFGANCYVVSENGSAAVIDIGIPSDSVLDYIKQNGLRVELILLTHGHFDHVSGAVWLRGETGAKIYIHRLDAELLTSAEKSLGDWDSSYGFVPFGADKTFSDGDKIPFAGKEFTVIHTPGHTKGSSCFEIDGNIFCGDLIFMGSVGRSDVYSSSPSEHIESLKRLKALSGDYKLYCGHGPSTTLDFERERNIYLYSLR
ncbi:MAG: MBL fold metallo-hydrolase [Oscillospiraceae bacterium]